MSKQANSDRAPSASEPALLERLLPPGETAGAQEIVEGYALGKRVAPAARPYLALNMVSSVDGRASVAGRSGGLGNRADRELFHALRGAVDAVLVGAGTVRAERYGRIIADETRRLARRERGLSEEPLACVVSARLELPTDIPLLSDPHSHVVIVTASEASLPDCGARVDYVRAERGGALDLPRALAELRARFDVSTLLCEGGPHLNGALLAAGLVDELFLTFAPLLAGGGADGAGELTITVGPELAPPAALELLSVARSESHLFLRYGV